MRALLTLTIVAATAGTVSAQVPAGSEFRVNTYTTDNQIQPRVAVAAGGDFVVVWEGNLQDGDRWGVFGQRFDAAGERRGIEWQINENTQGYQVAPVVAA